MINLIEVKKALKKQIDNITLDDIEAGDFNFFVGDYKTLSVNCQMTFKQVKP